MHARATPPPGRPTAGHEIPSLDGLRAVSFLIVFISHAGLQSVIPGGFGVTVFFFLSGFLITTLLRLEWEQHGTIRMRDFYLRRALRILPPFYTVLAAAALLTLLGVIPGSLAPAPMLAQALHVNNYWTIAHGIAGIPAGTGVYWSLAVEEHFYLVFPTLFLLLHRTLRTPRARSLGLLALCALVLAWRLVLVHALGASEDRTYMASDTRVDSILYGCALALWGNPALDPTRFARGIWRWVWLPLALGGLLVTFLDRDPAFRETWRYSIQGLALIPVFVVAVREPAWGPFRLLSLRPVRWMGVLSYSLYLMHHVVLGALHERTRLHPVLAGVLGLAICLALAALIHRAIERPCAALRRRLSHAIVGPRPAAPADGAGAAVAATHAEGPA